MYVLMQSVICIANRKQRNTRMEKYKNFWIIFMHLLEDGVFGSIFLVSYATLIQDSVLMNFELVSNVSFLSLRSPYIRTV